MSLRFLVLAAVLVGGAAPALAAPADAKPSRSCFRPDTAPPGKSLVTVRVIKCPDAKQISENDAKPATPNAGRTAID